MDKIYVLTCTWEDKYNDRGTDILSASFNKSFLEDKLRERVEEDPDGIYSRHELWIDTPDHVCTEWDDYYGYEELKIHELEIEDGKPEVFKADDLGAVLEV